MAQLDDNVRVLLERRAEEAGQLHVGVRDIERRVSARRSLAAVLAGAAVVAVVAVVVGLDASVMRLHFGSAGATMAGGSATSSGSAPATGLGSAAATSAHPLTCGAALPPPLTRTGPQGARVAVISATRSAATGTAVVAVRLTVTSAAQFTAPGLTPLQVLLLRDGQVVDRLGTYSFAPGDPPVDWLAEGAAGRGGRGAVGRVLTLAPTASWTVQVTGPGHCQGADWAAAWRSAPGYKVVAVMSVPHSAEQPTAAADDPLLTSSAHSVTK